jgi:hypothetical protein
MNSGLLKRQIRRLTSGVQSCKIGVDPGFWKAGGTKHAKVHLFSLVCMFGYLEQKLLGPHKKVSFFLF